MRQWPAMFIKDFKLTRTVFFIGLVMNVWIAILTLYMGRVADDSLLMFVPIAIAVAIHVAYVPIMVFISLKSEGNHLPLWLSNPQPAFKLLLSKIANGLMMIVISLAFLFALSGLLIVPKFNLIEPYWTDTWRVGLFIFPHIIWISIQLSVWAMVIWALYQCLKLKIGRWSRVAVVGVTILSGGGDALFKTTKLYRLVTEWGGIAYKFPAILSDPIQTYAGEYVYDFMIVVGLFILTAWLVDNKVEG
ncbi:hypothetical protein SD70_25740 [Gordoniibacillus kamchatkensis]|uniref:ABC transporter permease n=1 Tax=Gordoniibacillus kamchatkensis TaxID=1590651 RepID=A0ABR5ABV0_9BACL|nr:hypothetical protein [Paenibacillus sp. VKM B-2647]KIL38531.1 hypothetical protein SD70_25740 [Paenibacillus sp. VKM B-2647]